MNFNLPTRQKKRSLTISAEVKRNVTDDPDLTALADWYEVSNQAYFALIAGVLKSADVSGSEVTISKKTAKRNRDKNRQETAEKIRREFAEKTRYDILNIHWDEKIMEGVDKVSHERLVVVVSGKEASEGKIITALALNESQGTGKDIALLVHQAIGDNYLQDHQFFFYL